VKLRDLPNLITVLRFFLVPPVVVLLLRERYGEALAVFAVAGLSDAADGFLAKRYGWSSRLGGLLDPLADKALLVSSFVTLAVLGLLPAWLVAVVIARDVIIVGGAATYHLRIERLNAEPRLLSKLNTAGQIALVVAVMFSEGVARLPQGAVHTLVVLVLVTTALSGMDYVWTWSRRARRRGSPG